MTLTKADKEQRNDEKTRGILDQICARTTKGWAFGSGTDEEKIEKIKAQHKQVRDDFESLILPMFVKKYERCITKAECTHLIRNRSAANHAKEAEQREAERVKIQLEKCPPNRKFYSHTNLTDSKWHRYDTMPTDDELMERKAIRWTPGMMASAAHFLGGFCVTAIHKDGLIIEFEYIYENGKLYSPNVH